MSEATRILNAIQRGDAQAANELLPLVYQELRRLAAHKLADEAPEHALPPTGLVHLNRTDRVAKTFLRGFARQIRMTD